MIKKIEQFNSVAEIILIDNGSSYEPLLDWYSTLTHTVLRMPNLGHTAPWNSEINQKIKTDYYVVSDPDLNIDSVPLDCLEHLIYCLDKDLGKVGLGLEVNDIPKNSLFYNLVQNAEKKFWEMPLINDLYRSVTVDTTFAMYNKNILNVYNAMCGVRTDRPYVAKHMPWYVTHANLTKDEELCYYIKHASSTYSSFKKFLSI
jgi:hypothetical protein